MAEKTSDPVLLPPVVPIPALLTALLFLFGRKGAFRAVQRRYHGAFTVRLPVVGHAVVISDPVLAKNLFTTSSDLVARANNLGAVLGPGSTFSLAGAEHLRRRKLLVPPFHGKRMTGYESIVEQEALREVATWPEGREFATQPSMMRITLNVVLRAVFGAEGAEFDELRQILPSLVELGSRLAVLPPRVRRDYGPLSPGGRYAFYRRRYDALITRLIARARQDPDFAERTDVLSLLLAARYDDGEPISDAHIADELLTLLAAGHETTATTLAWAVERIRRHPDLLERLAAEADAGGTELLQAVVWEVQRTRPVVEGTGRLTHARIRLGRWVIPEGRMVVVPFRMLHLSQQHYEDPELFNPDRFVGNPPDTTFWVPYGGGVNRCVGAAFANMEMLVTLRTLLREFEFGTTTARGERNRSRGVTTAAARGGRAVVRRRRTDARLTPVGSAAGV
ncbi:cytochrome P450 [Mycolicibacter engbaekii]|uniref:Cytochrome P450 n=1 Tax=Mycolicibacter engbaekii TaxID=188915 RepID=A0A1X1TZL5_9MYCO|nr:cytochrome P450 [Mycolicibacter engbaekii]ORV50016.1 cytochrome P450 [Mycolicibacter engbaekii]